jgi:two-component sensor histidine kinase
MSLAKIYDHLLGNGLSRTIDFDQYVRSLCDSLSAFQGNREFHVILICEGKANPLPLDLDSVTALGIVIAEIVSNAYIHAFPGRVAELKYAELVT